MPEFPFDIRPLTNEYVRGEIRIQASSRKRTLAVQLILAQAAVECYQALTGKLPTVSADEYLAKVEESARANRRPARR